LLNGILNISGQSPSAIGSPRKLRLEKTKKADQGPKIAKTKTKKQKQKQMQKASNQKQGCARRRRRRKL
jgi:hypothetical protein